MLRYLLEDYRKRVHMTRITQLYPKMNVTGTQTVRYSSFNWFVSFARLAEPRLIFCKHSKHVVAAFEQPCRLVLQRRGVDIGQEYVLGALHVSLLDDVTSQR